MADVTLGFDGPAKVEVLAEAGLVITEAAAATATLDSTPAKSDLTFTAQAEGKDGNKIGVMLVDPGEASAALAVDVQGNIIIVSLETDGNGDIASTAAEVVAAIEANAEADALVAVADEDDGSGVVEAQALAFLAGGLEAITAEQGEFVVIESILDSSGNITAFCWRFNPESPFKVDPYEQANVDWADLLAAVTEPA